jgi:dimeric dUTPase (all-alpha-NTP-PPase superfamily)
MVAWKWLASTKELQEEVYGYIFKDLDLSSDEEQLLKADYINWNQTAAVQELAEVREEFSWKPWATDAPFVNTTRIRDEIIDVMHFLGNILVSIGVDDEELAEAYRQKQEINRLRASSGTYSARKGGIAEGSDNI